MRILIVHTNSDLAKFWGRHLSRLHAESVVATSSDSAIKLLRFDAINIVILDMALPHGDSFAISDHIGVFHPHVPIVAITSSTFFSGSDLYEMMPNARALMSMPVQLEDLKAIVEFYGAQNDPYAGYLRAVS